MIAAAAGGPASVLAALVTAVFAFMGAVVAALSGRAKDKDAKGSSERSLGLEELKAALAEGRAMRDEQNRRIDELEAKDAMTQALLADMRRALRERDNEIEQLRADGRRKDERIARLEADGERKDERIAELETEISRLKEPQ